MNHSQRINWLVGVLTLAIGTLNIAAAEQPGRNGKEIVTAKAGEPPPFIRVREALSSVPWGGWIKTDMPAELRQKYFMTFWPEARLRRQLEMLKAFGFNSVQLFANPVVAWWVGADAPVRFLPPCQRRRRMGRPCPPQVWQPPLKNSRPRRPAVRSSTPLLPNRPGVPLPGRPRHDSLARHSIPPATSRDSGIRRPSPAA